MEDHNEPAPVSPVHPSQSLVFCTTPKEFKNQVDMVKEEPSSLAPIPSHTTVENVVLEELQPYNQPSWNLAIITLSLALGTFLVALDTLIIGIAVPTITSQFHSLDDIAWYGSAYLITTTALQPSFGRVYKLYSAKTTYLLCVCIFEVGSIICATAPSSKVFILGRAIAGCGAAGLFQGALNVITNTVPLGKRPLYLGMVVSVFGISICIGPVLGGAFTQHASWRWCFWINVPIGCVTFFLILFFLKMKRQKHSSTSLMSQLKQLDPFGAGILLAAIVCLFLALQWGGQTKPWNSSTVIGLFIGFGLLFSFFCILQWKMGENATIPLRVLGQRSILFGSLFLFFIANSGYIYGYYLPIYFQSIKGSTPTKSGLQFMALAFPQIIGVIASGAVASRWGYYVPYMIAGTAISIVGSTLLITLNAYTSTVKWSAFCVIAGVGTGISVNLPYTAIQVVLKEEDVPTGNAISQFIYQLGAAISLFIGQTIFLNKLTSEVSKKTTAISPKAVIAVGAYGLPKLNLSPDALRQVREAYASAVSHTFIYALVVVCAAFIFTFGMEQRNVKATAKRRLEERAGVVILEQQGS